MHFFNEFRLQYLITDTSDILSVPSNCEHIVNMFDGYNISKLDVRRIYRFLDKTSKRDTNAIITDESIGQLIFLHIIICICKIIYNNVAKGLTRGTFVKTPELHHP